MVVFPDEVMNQIREHCLDLAKLEWMKRRTSDIQRVFVLLDFYNCVGCRRHLNLCTCFAGYYTVEHY